VNRLLLFAVATTKWRGFFNVCRHHAGSSDDRRRRLCQPNALPLSRMTYSLEGELKGTPDFNDVCGFDLSENGLLPVEIASWENGFFARLANGSKQSLEDFLDTI